MNGPDERDVLQAKFVAILARCPPASPVEIWHLCCSDPWFMRELASQARRIIEKSRGPPDLLGDIQHEAMLILANRLAQSPNLGLEAQATPGRFQALLTTVLRNASKKAYRLLRRIYHSGVELPSGFDIPNALAQAIARARDLDVALAIDELPEPLCSVVWLYLWGKSKREISRYLGRPYREVCLALTQGISRILRDLGP